MVDVGWAVGGAPRVSGRSLVAFRSCVPHASRRQVAEAPVRRPRGVAPTSAVRSPAEEASSAGGALRHAATNLCTSSLRGPCLWGPVHGTEEASGVIHLGMGDHPVPIGADPIDLPPGRWVQEKSSRSCANSERAHGQKWVRIHADPCCICIRVAGTRISVRPAPQSIGPAPRHRQCAIFRCCMRRR